MFRGSFAGRVVQKLLRPRFPPLLELPEFIANTGLISTKSETNYSAVTGSPNDPAKIARKIFGSLL